MASIREMHMWWKQSSRISQCIKKNTRWNGDLYHRYEHVTNAAL